MIKLSLTSKICFLVCLVFLNSPDQLFSQDGASWRVKNRLQTSFEHDDNIREIPSSLDTTSKKLSDSSFKILFHSRASRKTKKSLLRIHYKGGLQNYFDHSFENKLINELSGYALYPLGNFKFGFNVSGRLKVYLNDNLDYASGSAEAFIMLPKAYSFTNNVAIKAGGLEYKDDPLFNYKTSEISWSISRRLYKKLSGQLSFQAGKISYDRAGITESFDFKTVEQQDDKLGLKLNLNYTKRLLINFSYLLENNTSNAFGYSYNKHQFTMILGLPFAKTFWLRGYGALQLKQYDEKTLPVYYTDVDTERDESNFFILDLSKDISPNLSGLLRLAFYNNESIIRSLFYNKLLFTAGFDFRF